MAKDIDEKIGARSQKNWHGLKYKNPLKNYLVHEMPTGEQFAPALYSQSETIFFFFFFFFSFFS